MECEQGEPDLFVCMACLNEVYRSRVPTEGCPECSALSSFEAFNLESIQEWGTEELIQKAQAEAAIVPSSETSVNQPISPEDSLPA